MEDANTCLICSSLNGYKWTETDIYQNTLWSPIWGDVYDLTQDKPITHGGGHNCRCDVTTEVKINLQEFTEIKELNEILNMRTATDGGYPEELNSVTDIENYRQKITELKQEINGLTLSYSQLKEFETLLRRTLMIVEKSTGDEDIRKSIQVIERAITTVRTLQLAITSLEMASGPIGYALAATSFIMGAYQGVSLYEDLRGSS
jgi:hypothetical protein